MTDEQEICDLLAEEVMGWKLDNNHTGDKVWKETKNGHSWNPYYVDEWQPTQNIEHALKCAEKYCKGHHCTYAVEGSFIREDLSNYGTYWCGVNSARGQGTEKTPELAICSALVEAVMK